MTENPAPEREAMIVSVTSDGRYALHPPFRRPDRFDPVFETIAEAEAYLAGTSASDNGARFEVDATTDPMVEIMSIERTADGDRIVTGLVDGCTIRATCRGTSIEIDPRDLEDAGLDPSSERAYLLTLLWSDHLAKLIGTGEL